MVENHFLDVGAVVIKTFATLLNFLKSHNLNVRKYKIVILCDDFDAQMRFENALKTDMALLQLNVGDPIGRCNKGKLYDLDFEIMEK